METMVRVLVDRPPTEAEWDALVDPDDGRYEVLDGRVVVSPSANADHSRFCEDLAHLLRSALRHVAADLPVTLDVEWRTVADDVVAQAPRGDVVVGRSLDHERRIHNAVPVLVAEVWSALTAVGTRNSRREYWASVGLRHYWELLLGDTVDDAALVVWDLSSGEVLPSAHVRGHDTAIVDEPVPIEITPALIPGSAQRDAQRAERLASRLRELGLPDD